MEQEQFVETGSKTFYGEYLYDQIVPKEHFLRKLREVVDWGYFTRRLIKIYKRQGVIGRLPFDPALVLKVEVIPYLYKLSERQVDHFSDIRVICDPVYILFLRFFSLSFFSPFSFYS